MARPKKAQRPDAYDACARCGEHRAHAAFWPDGLVCQNCYRKAHRTTGSCVRCGHEGVLPGVTADGPTCRSCSGISINLDCVRCGREDELYSAGRCWHCTLADLVDDALSNPRTGLIAEPLQSLAAALEAMKRANSGLTWIRQPHVQSFLRELATTGTVQHENIDALPRSPTREYVRGLLVEHGVLPRRDHYLAAFHDWTVGAIARVTTAEHRDVIEQWIRWEHLRKMRAMGDVPRGTFLRSKQAITVAIDFLNWLSDREITLASAAQEDIDLWLATGASTRRQIDRFLPWAKRSRLTGPDLVVGRHRRGTSPRMGHDEQVDVTQTLLTSTELTARDRAIGMLILVFGQQLEKVLHLTWDDLTVTEIGVAIRLGQIHIELPPPLDEVWRDLHEYADEHNTAAHPKTKWVFTGHQPGRPINPGHIATHLRDLFSARAARLGTLHELSKLGPVPVIAESLGYSATTIAAHRTDSGSTYAEYVGAVKAANS